MSYIRKSFCSGFIILGFSTMVVPALGQTAEPEVKMSKQDWQKLDDAIMPQYQHCWSGDIPDTNYIPKIQVELDRHGALAQSPILLNPPKDKNEEIVAFETLRAVRKCNPLKIPEELIRFHQQWKKRVLRFDPNE